MWLVHMNVFSVVTFLKAALETLMFKHFPHN